jgi:hypothetical protein
MKFLRILGWAIFLGMSWTWCIGMYLPALLVRDYGIWAFVVFAVPNVVGAAAMAWVLPDGEASRKLVEKHTTACEWFSIVTGTFNAFFLGWIAFGILLPGGDFEGWLLVYLVVYYGAYGRVDRDKQRAAIAVTVISAIIAIAMLVTRSVPLLPKFVPPSANLIGLAGVCLFGFLLCPYLDLTFHEARQATTSSEGKAAFFVGFVVVFLSAILFSLGYSGYLTKPQELMGGGAVVGISVYMVTQLTLKFILHGDALGFRFDSDLRNRNTLFYVCFIVALFGGMHFSQVNTILRGMRIGELIYRLFLSFYGLFFPAYVWICIFGKKNWRVWLVAVLIAAPMYWMGFIERQMIWLLPGVAIPFITGLLPFSRARPIPSGPRVT